MQALEFEITLVFSCDLDECSYRVSIMCGEHRIENITAVHHLCGVGKIRNISRILAGEDRIAGQAIDLRILDLAVPVSTFDEAYHHAAAVFFAEGHQPVKGAA